MTVIKNDEYLHNLNKIKIFNDEGKKKKSKTMQRNNLRLQMVQI